MPRKQPRYPRLVTRPSRARPYVIVNEYGFEVHDYDTLDKATAALELWPFRGTTFGQWWQRRKDGQA